MSEKSNMAYPLQWPAGWPRTPRDGRAFSRYEVLGDRAISNLYRSIDLLGGDETVLSTNVRLRRDGDPLVSELRMLYEDPGVAVYFRRGGRPVVLACDKFRHVDENIRAIGLCIEGMRAIARSGAHELLDRAFTGFVALPETQPPWWTILKLDRATATRALIDQAYTREAKVRHPDMPTGSHNAFLQLEAAYASARKERTQ